MKILVVVDMQNDFIDEALGSKEAQAIVPNVVEKIEECKKNREYAIIYTRDTHFQDYLSTKEGKDLPVPHCIIGSYGWNINGKVDAASYGAHYVERCDKLTFGMKDIAEVINAIPDYAPLYESWDVESIEIVGVCTDICVISNALILKANYPGADIKVYQNCCAGSTLEKHEAALEVMRSCQIEVV